MPWNKGLTKETDHRVKKYAEALKGSRPKKEKVYNVPPDQWIINCTVCGKPKPAYNNYKFFLRKYKEVNELGKSCMCDGCKKLHLSKNYPTNETTQSVNPELWKIDCTDCKHTIMFDNYNNFKNTQSRYKGRKFVCLNCQKSKKLVSDDPTTWHIPCSTCGDDIYYDNIRSFRTVYYKFLKGKLRNCPDCHNKREMPPSPLAIYSFNPEDWKIPCSTEGCENINVYTSRKSYQESKKLHNEGNGKMCTACAGRLARRKNDELNRFKPAYNYRSIDYIDEVLSVRFGHKFRHAETENGEHYIDTPKGRLYADAFCEELNLWIEFDEYYKFSFGKLLQEHVDRHHLIKTHSDYNLIRFHSNKKYEFNEYYNELTNFGINLIEQIKFVK